MKTLYESILDTDFSVSIPGENLPGADRIFKILNPFVKTDNSGQTYKTNKYILKDLKNTLDNLAKRPPKDKPTKKWVVVCYNDNVGIQKTENNKDFYRSKKEELRIYRLNNDGSIQKYRFLTFNKEVIFMAILILPSSSYNEIKTDKRYCVPPEICDLIDYVINNK